MYLCFVACPRNRGKDISNIEEAYEREKREAEEARRLEQQAAEHPAVSAEDGQQPPPVIEAEQCAVEGAESVGGAAAVNSAGAVTSEPTVAAGVVEEEPVTYANKPSPVLQKVR